MSEATLQSIGPNFDGPLWQVTTSISPTPEQVRVPAEAEIAELEDLLDEYDGPDVAVAAGLASEAWTIDWLLAESA